MPADRPPNKAPAKAGAESTHQVSPPGLIADAVPGNRAALARAYGHAGAWLRDGMVPPEDLASWIGERLLALSQVLHDDHDKKLAGVNAALGLVEVGKRGRKPATRLEKLQRAALVLDVRYQQQRWDCTLEEAFERVVAFHVVAGHYISAVQVESAWKDRKRLIPEIDS